MGSLSSSTSPGLLTETLQMVPSAGAPVKVEMVLRVWSPSSREAESGSYDETLGQHPGLLAFIEDVVAAKGGQFHAAHNQLSVRGLEKPTDALVIARRIQFGLQGFRGKGGNEPVAVSIAIDSSSASGRGAELRPEPGSPARSEASETAGETPVEPSHDLLTLLKISKPAQVLVTHDVCQRSTAVKCLPLKSFPARFGVFEYLWTAPDKLEILQSEPQLTLVSMPGTSHPATAARAAAQPAAAGDAGAAAHAGGEASLPQAKGTDWQAALRSPRFAIFAGLAVVVVGLASFVGVHLAHESAQKPATTTPVPASTTVQTPGPSAGTAETPASTPSTPPAAEKGAASAAGTSAKRPAAQRGHKPDQHAAKAAEPAAPCNLPGNVSESVHLAEMARARGDYASAIRLFREVLACDPSNASAKTGLDRAVSAQEQSRRPQ